MEERPDDKIKKLLGRARSLGEAGFAAALATAAKAYRGTTPLSLASVERGEDGRAIISLIAPPDPDHYDAPWHDSAPLCQSGTCAACGVSLRSWAKFVLCPACGSKAFCT